jgi:hypothetical protein
MTITVFAVAFLIAAILAIVALVKQEGHQLGTWAIAIVAVALTVQALGIIEGL